MNFYAIRSRRTGLYLPASPRKRGFTNDEPTDMFPPRLFTRKHDAQVALTWWLRGMMEKTFTGPPDDPDERIHVTPVPSRLQEEMVVVEVWIQLVTKR